MSSLTEETTARVKEEIPEVKSNVENNTVKNEEITEVKLPVEKKDDVNNTPTSKWTAVWDDNAQAYYWWNTENNETTWINPESNGEEYDAAAAVAAAAQVPGAEASNPLDFLLDRIDAVVKKKLDDGEEYQDALEHTSYASSYDQQQYYEQPEASYTSTAHFNARTGRFTTQEDVNRLNPENLTIESRAKRQMQFYFDVDSYTEERNNQKLLAQEGRVGKKKQLTRKEVEHFKKMKKEKKSKKAREWLMQ